MLDLKGHRGGRGASQPPIRRTQSPSHNAVQGTVRACYVLWEKLLLCLSVVPRLEIQSPSLLPLSLQPGLIISSCPPSYLPFNIPPSCRSVARRLSPSVTVYPQQIRSCQAAGRHLSVCVRSFRSIFCQIFLFNLHSSFSFFLLLESLSAPVESTQGTRNYDKLPPCVLPEFCFSMQNSRFLSVLHASKH